jgi:hypothetical protein
MTFLIIFAGLVGVGILVWILINTFTTEQRESRDEGQRPS